jgi:hypothetical protein
MNHKLLTATVLIFLATLLQNKTALGQASRLSHSEHGIDFVAEAPPCFMITSDGRMVDLTSLCNTPTSTNDTPSSTTSQPTQNSESQPSPTTSEPAEDAEPQFVPQDAAIEGVG